MLNVRKSLLERLELPVLSITFHIPRFSTCQIIDFCRWPSFLLVHLSSWLLVHFTPLPQSNSRPYRLLSSRSTPQSMRSIMFVAALLLCCVVDCHAGIPRKAKIYPHQLVDHHASSSSTPYFGREFQQRYYDYTSHFAGPGNPIFLILGGEGAIEEETGIFYPFIVDLAESFGAYVLEPEHRFYGTSQPLSAAEIEKVRKKGKPDPRVKLLNPDQALRDAIRLTKFVASRLRCSRDRFSKHYCPIITVGGSYPGFLSAMARAHFPDFVDMAYAASAPMGFYAQQVAPDAYYNHITVVAERAYPGCAKNVKSALMDFVAHSNMNTTAVGICDGTLPDYIQDSETFVDEVLMMVGYTFCNANMGYYPPSNNTRLYRACETFSSYEEPLVKLRAFLVDSLPPYNNTECFNMTEQLPSGPMATISSGDWSGVGTGQSGESWDFQTCSSLVEAIGFGGNSMFPRRSWNLEWLIGHCQSRFGVTPEPHALVDEWKFGNLTDLGASRIIFTNGLNDGWSVSGIQQNLSESLIAINFPNGAHHSDLSGVYAPENDTPDIVAGYTQVRSVLATWLSDMPHHRNTTWATT